MSFHLTSLIAAITGAYRAQLAKTATLNWMSCTPTAAPIHRAGHSGVPAARRAAKQRREARKHTPRH